MNAEQLWDTTMKPDNRVLLQVEVHDAAASDKLFYELMGDEVIHRRRFIQANLSWEASAARCETVLSAVATDRSRQENGTSPTPMPATLGG